MDKETDSQRLRNLHKAVSVSVARTMVSDPAFSGYNRIQARKKNNSFLILCFSLYEYKSVSTGVPSQYSPPQQLHWGFATSYLEPEVSTQELLSMDGCISYCFCGVM